MRKKITLFKNLDMVVLVSTILILIIGILLLYSASQAPSVIANPPIWKKQLIWITLGFAAMTIFYGIDFYSLAVYVYPLYVLTMAFLLLILFLGHIAMGAQRWFNLGFMLFQPSELAKLTTLLLMSRFVVENQNQMHRLKNFLFPLVYIVPMVVLIYLQPDFGTAMILMPLTLVILFVGGSKAKYFINFMIFFFLSFPFIWLFMRDYQRNRLLFFLQPETDPLGGGYSIIQSMIAVGSGKFFGKGWLVGTQIHRDFIPQHYTDFIFAVLGEEWGFIGCFVLIFLYLLLLLEGMKISKQAREPLGRLIACGVVALLGLQIFVNVGMTIGLMPITGLPLPFVSYGGSSLIVSMSCVGLLLNVSKNTLRRRR